MQSKIKRKFVSLMLAASLAGSPLATFPMNVFAGTGKTGVIKAPEMEQQQQLEAAKAELEQVKVQLATMRTDLTTANEGLQKTNEELQKTNKGLTTANGELQKKIEGLQKKIDELQKTIEGLQKTNKGLITANGELQKTKDELQKTKDELQKTIEGLQKKNGELQEQLENVQEELKYLKSKVTEVTISGGEVINIGKNLVLTANFKPEGVYEAYKTVEWNVTGKDMDDTDINVRATGITAKINVAKAGTVKITATAKNGSTDKNDWKSNFVDITVAQPVTGVTIDNIPDNNEIDINKPFKLAAIFDPTNAYANYKKVEWKITGKDAKGNNMSDENLMVTENEDNTVTIKVNILGAITVQATTHNGEENGSADISSKKIKINSLYEWTFSCTYEYKYWSKSTWKYETTNKEFSQTLKISLDSTWQDMLNKYSGVFTTKNNLLTDYLTVIVLKSYDSIELKNSQSTHDYELVQLEDKVFKYGLNQYYLEQKK